MRCPFCKADDDKVVDSRLTEAGRSIRRRRKCLRCGRRFTTYERVEETIRLTVISATHRVPYDREKMREVLFGRPTSGRFRGCIDQIVDEVEEYLVSHFEKEVSSQTIGERIAAVLRRVDKVAYAIRQRLSAV